MASLPWMLLCSTLIFTLGLCDVYKDDIIQASVSYEYTVYSTDEQEGKAIMNIEALKNVKGHPVLSLTSVLDISESMDTAHDVKLGEKTRLEFLKLANRYVVDRLASQPGEHEFGTVVFSTDVEDLTPVQEVTEASATEIKNKINSVAANGYTNLHGGIIRGIKQQNEDKEDRLRAVLLFTDGMPTYGEYLESSAIIKSIKASLKEAGDVRIHVIAIGETINYDLLRDIAETGSGVFYHVVKDEDIPKAFAAVLGGLLTESASKVEFTFFPAGGLVITDARMNGGSVSWMEAGTVKVQVGSLLLEEKRRIVVYFNLSSSSESEDGLSISGSYENALTQKTVSISFESMISKRVADVGDTTSLMDVGWWGFRYDVCEWLEVAADQLEDGDQDAAVAELMDVKTKISNSAYANESYTVLMQKDLEKFYTYLTRDDEETETTAKDRGMLDGLISVIGGGRPSSVDLVFNIINEEETTLPRTFIIEVERYMSGEAPKPLFEMGYAHAVNHIEGKGKPQYEVLLTLKPPPVGGDVPLSLTIVVDKDGAAEDGDDTYEKMIATLKKVVNDLKDKSHVSLGIVLSSGSAKTVLDLKKASEIDVDALFEEIDAFESVGETALDDAIKMALDQQTQHKIASGSQVVFVITDGTPVDGDDIVAQAKEQLAESKKSINIHSFGFDGSDEESLKSLASISDGSYRRLYYTNDLSVEVGYVLWGLLKIGAKNVNIRVRPIKNGISVINSLPARDKDSDGWTTTFRDIYQGEKRDVIMTIEAPRTAMRLVEIEITYTDVLKPALTTSDTVTILSNGGGSTLPPASINNRKLDQKVITRLQTSIKGSLTRTHVPYVVDVIYQVIRVVKNEKNVDEDYKTGLTADLEMIALKMDNAQHGTEKDVSEAEWIWNLFIQMLKTQRYPGGSCVQFEVQSRYVHANSQERVKIYGCPHPPPPLNLPDPFKMTFVNTEKELTTDRQDVIFGLKFEAIDFKKELQPHASHVFLLDATQETKNEEIAKAKEGVLSRWRAVQNSAVSQQSHMVIMAYGTEVSTILEKKLISEITEEDINNAFLNVTSDGDLGFEEAVTAAIDVVGKIRADDASDDVNLIAFLRNSIMFEERQADADTFVQEVEKLDFPLTFVPIVLNEDIAASYFDVYPGWVQHTVISIDDWIERSASTFEQPIVKRLIIHPNPAQGNYIVDISNTFTAKEGYLLPDLYGSEERQITFTLTLSASDSSQILRMPRLVMWDMREQKERVIRGEALSITRTPLEDITTRINVQKEINTSVAKIDKTIDEEDWNQMVIITSITISIIDESGVDDDNIFMMRGDLWRVGEIGYALIGGEGDGEEARNITKEISLTLIIDKVPIVPPPSIMKDPPIPTDVDENVLKKTPDPPQLIVESGVQARTTEADVAIHVQIKGQQQNAEWVKARAIILLDTSEGADWKRQQTLALELLKSLASRQGKRSVEIWGWSDVVNQLYTNDDFGPEDMEEASAILEAVTLKGQTDAAKVLDHVQSIRIERDVITVVYWVAASAVPDIEESTLVEYIAALKRHTTKTVMTFKTDTEGGYSNVMKQIGDLTGGWSYFIQNEEASEDDIIRRIRDAAWTSVGWIEQTYIKNVVVRVTGKNGAVVSKIDTAKEATATNQGLMLPSLPYGKDLDMKITVQLDQLTDKKIGRRDVLSITTEYVFVRVPYSRQLEEDRVVSVELLENGTLNKIDTMDTLFDTVGRDIFYHLGRNEVENALMSIGEATFQPELAGLQDREDVKNRVQIYQQIEEDLNEYLMERYNYDLLGKVTNLVVTSTTEKKYYVDDTSYLKIRHGPLSFEKTKSHFHPSITIETPQRKPLAPWELESKEVNVIMVAVIFDAAKYDVRIDGEMSPLTVQKMTVHRLMKKLVKSGYSVDLTVISSRQDDDDNVYLGRFDSDNIGEFKDQLDSVEAKGTPSNLLSSLKVGLPHIEDVEGFDRFVVLFTHASSIGLVEESAYEKLLMPYVAPPINPVKVLTYVLGKHKTTQPDVVSDLTGGLWTNIEHVLHIPRAVRKSFDSIATDGARSVRVEVTPAEWYKNDVQISSGGKPLRFGILGDMKFESSQSIDLSLDLGKWNGDRDIFDYALSYYLPKYKRWYRTPTSTFRLRRATKDVVKEHVLLKEDVSNALGVAVGQLDTGSIQKAYVTVHKALGTVHRSAFQDDSLICSYSKCLMQTYGEIMRLSLAGEKDATTVVNALKNDDCHLGLDVKETFVTSVKIASEGDEPVDSLQQREDSWYSFAV